MTLASWLAESSAWALAGFLVGYLLGRATVATHRIATGEDTVPTRPSGQYVLGIVVVLLGVITVLQGITTTTATQRLTACQADYANQFADALDARQQASSDAQAALDDLMADIGGYLAEPQTSPERVRAAIDEYRAKRAAAVADRQANPYPPPPRDLCPEGDTP